MTIIMLRAMKSGRIRAVGNSGRTVTSPSVAVKSRIAVSLESLRFTSARWRGLEVFADAPVDLNVIVAKVPVPVVPETLPRRVQATFRRPWVAL